MYSINYDNTNTENIHELLILDCIDIEGTRLSSEIITYSNRPDRVVQLAEHWASIPKVVGSIPTVPVARHIFQACPVCMDIHSE